MDLQIDQVAELARLKLTPEEKNKLAGDLARILDYIQSLASLPTEAVTPTSHVLDLENVTRPDEVRPSAVRGEVLKYAPHAEGLFFKVPKVVDK